MSRQSDWRCLWLVPVFLLCAFTAQAAPPRLKCVTWNVNGAGKLKSMVDELTFLSSFDIIFLQETFTGSIESALDIPGFIPHHQLGRSAPRGTRWGLSTFLKIDAFVGGVICRIPSPVDWLVASRWRMDTNLGLLLVNVYLPVHTDGFSPTGSQQALSFIKTLRLDFPGDGLLIGGDLNVDRWRVSDQRALGSVISSNTRSV
jgi:exonuclease III